MFLGIPNGCWTTGHGARGYRGTKSGAISPADDAGSCSEVSAGFRSRNSLREDGRELVFCSSFVGFEGLWLVWFG